MLKRLFTNWAPFECLTLWQEYCAEVILSYPSKSGHVGLSKSSRSNSKWSLSFVTGCINGVYLVQLNEKVTVFGLSSADEKEKCQVSKAA